MICEDTEEDSRVRLAAKSLRLRSAVVVPVQAQGSVLGVVEVLSSRASAFNTAHIAALQHIDRKSTRLNSSHANISYAVFCLKKKTQKENNEAQRKNTLNSTSP